MSNKKYFNFGKDELRQIIFVAQVDFEVVIHQKSAPGKKAKSKKKDGPTKLSPKYRNPENPDQTWHGRGPRPDWLIQLIYAGRQKEEFLIPGMK